jgi:uncharacterized metal-binding protein (TIGR02443 family)
VTIKKRFIAGAVCPKCKAMDRLMVYRAGNRDFRECVECGFKDEMRFQSQSRELQTRVNSTAENIAAETSTVKIIPMNPKS